MSSRFNFKRWVMVVLLACLAGVLLPCAIVCVSRRMQPTYDFPRSAVPRPAPAPRRLSQEQVRVELIQVIESQLAAFRNDDYPAAYKCAAAELRDSMPLPEFERMVRRDYAPIARCSSAEFGAALDNGTEGIVTVDVHGRAGKVVRYGYLLKLEAGNWKINGVVALRAPNMEI